MTVNAAAPNANVSPLVAPTPPTKTANTKIAPDALVADLYKQHDAQKSPFFQNTNRALVDKYFTKATADIIWKDEIETKVGEEGALGADPLYDAQDTDIKNFAVGKPLIDGEAASVPVTFTNFGEKKTIGFVLNKENGAWKIVDIMYEGDRSLLDDYQANADADSSELNAAIFEGKYQIGNTTCTVKPIKMAFEVKWAKGTGTEIFFSEGRADDREIFSSHPKKANPILLLSTMKITTPARFIAPTARNFRSSESIKTKILVH